MSKIEYFESIETAPFKRWQKFNKFLNKKAETGDEPNDIFKRVDRIIGYAGANNIDAVVKEAVNLKMAYHQMMSEVSLDGLAHAVMVKSIDGVECKDITTEGLEKVLQQLSDAGLTKNEISEKNESIKKKSIESYVLIFLSLLVVISLIIMWLV